MPDGEQEPGVGAGGDAFVEVAPPEAVEFNEAKPVSTRSPLHWSKADSKTAFLVLAIKGLVLAGAVLSVGVLFDQYESWATFWNRWDATH
jgi:hypothetical protein